MDRRGIRVLRPGWGESAELAEVGPDCIVEVYRSEEFKEEVTVLRQGASSKSESCQEL